MMTFLRNFFQPKELSKIDRNHLQFIFSQDLIIKLDKISKSKWQQEAEFLFNKLSLKYSFFFPATQRSTNLFASETMLAKSGPEIAAEEFAKYPKEFFL